MTIKEFEIKRQNLQIELDGRKTQKERNVLGQFSTPNPLAIDILKFAKALLPRNKKIRFLDPAFGTGSFYSALRNQFSDTKIEFAKGYEIDEHYGKPSSKLWSSTKLIYEIADFTKQEPPVEDEKFNLLICNPPYVRHHHINGQKKYLQAKAKDSANIELNGLTGLYCYFMAIAHPWMKTNGLAGWLIPSEFMDVNYGRAIKDYLLNDVTLIRIHRFDPNKVQFDDALVSSAIVWFKNKKPSETYTIKFSFGGTLLNPKIEKNIKSDKLFSESKWTRFPLLGERTSENYLKLSDFFNVKRGIATGDNKYFILTANEIEEKKLPINQFRPILPSPRDLETFDIKTDGNGNPKISKKLFVLDSKLSIEEIAMLYPNLKAYLDEGIKSGVTDRYLCKNRKVWYSQENRPESLFYCTYIGRSDKGNKKTFNFILNESKAIVTNSYLILYPKPYLQELFNEKPEFIQTVYDSLNSIEGQDMLAEGRVYGGGMYKLEPKELSKVRVPYLEQIVEKLLTTKNLVKNQ
jgi:hypothetical protein